MENLWISYVPGDEHRNVLSTVVYNSSKLEVSPNVVHDDVDNDASDNNNEDEDIVKYF